ncbi:MAG: PEGA domain-containing protein [Acidobacteriota bacterium]|nr:MAG: PEGA domain-containing protein [Acidobacteriota bacterium]
MRQGHRVTRILLIVLCLSISQQAYGQKRSDRSKDTKKPPTAPGPKRTTRTIPENERVRVITRTEFVKVVVLPDKGYLSVVAVPGAKVSLSPVGQPKADSLKQTVTDRDGSLNLINLQPGQYNLVIEHADYNTFSETITIKPALLDTFVALNKMVSIYGGIRIGGAPAGARIYLDDAPVATSKMIVDNQNYVMPKIEVGRHRLRISKPGFVEFNREIDVVPGEQTFISAALDLARVTVNLISEPGARVYVGSEEKATIPPGRNLTLQLLPGRQPIRVIKDGYQDWTRELNLAMTEPVVTERADLVPIPSSVEGDWQPPIGARKWFPQAAGWNFSPSGAAIKGDRVVLFDTETNRDFNTYRDFRLEFDVVFTNRKGAAWAVRAKDPANYYLFEISGPASGSPVMNFYICRNGQLEWKDSRPVVEKIDKPGDSFHIIFEARGNSFNTSLSIASAPSTQPHRIAIFQDDEFTWGGVGFRGKDLSEFLLQTFFILPIK